MTTQNLPTIDLLRKLLQYDPDTGALYWRARSPDMFRPHRRRAIDARCAEFNALWAGRETGLAKTSNGYRMVSIKVNVVKYSLLAHRVAWALRYGRYPDGHIDHLNGVRSDNRIANLRVVTPAENGLNARRRSNNVSGFGGVYYKMSRRKWIAGITVGGQRTHLGVFERKFDAVLARLLAERAHGFTARHGI